MAKSVIPLTAVGQRALTALLYAAASILQQQYFGLAEVSWLIIANFQEATSTLTYETVPFSSLLTMRDASSRKILFRLARLMESQERHWTLTDGLPSPTIPHLLRGFQEKNLQVKRCCTTLNVESELRSFLPLERKSPSGRFIIWRVQLAQ